VRIYVLVFIPGPSSTANPRDFERYYWLTTGQSITIAGAAQRPCLAPASLALGVPVGLAAGYLGGWVDALISRITDAMLACPFLILAIALAAFLGPASPTP
jgi:ABC-type dipeptide/oligopeptide/nickel transport system permease subunit